MNKEVNYLKEHLYEIYQYKKSMKDLTYDMDLEHLLRTCKALDYLQKENKKQKEILDKIKEIITSEDICIDTRKTDGSMDYVDLKQIILELLEEIKYE